MKLGKHVFLTIKRISGIAFALMLCGIGIFMLYNGAGSEISALVASGSASFEGVEAALTKSAPWTEQMHSLRVALNFIGGGKEQNGIYIADGMLMRDVRPAGQSTINANTSAVIQLAKSIQRPTYLMLIPTASAVVQSKVPYSDIAPLYSQRQLIDDVYRIISGNVTAIDVYPVLFNHQTEQIYYNTQNAPTGLGGYYIYTAAARKLGSTSVYGLEQFSVEHIDNEFYGELYEQLPFFNTSADRVSSYTFTNAGIGRVSCVMTHRDENGVRRYFTLYPRFKQQLGSSLDVILGGVSPLIDIEMGKPRNDRNLLIIGDETVQSYLPFLLSHYSHVTFIEAAGAKESITQLVDPDEYSQILVALSVDGFVQSQMLENVAELFSP